MTNKITIELDLDEPANKRLAKYMLDAEYMKACIDTYHGSVLRKHYKHEELTDDEHALLVRITKELAEHFADYLED